MITQLPLEAIEWFLTESHLYAAYIVYFLIQQWYKLSLLQVKK